MSAPHFLVHTKKERRRGWRRGPPRPCPQREDEEVVATDRLRFWGYRRENGRVGVRNHVVILPLDDLSNAAAEAVAHNIKGTLALPHAYGRLQFGEDLELFFRTIIGTGSNPNGAAGGGIGMEPEWT